MSEKNNDFYRAIIPKVPEGIHRPLWSVMIPSYNCARYLRETLASILAQDPGPDVMQIMVVDDHSTQDDPEAVVKEVGQGRVEFYQQPQNVGMIKNYQACLELSRGKLIHQLHGDDCVRQGFYKKMERAFDEVPDIGAAYCRHIIMDEHGHWQYFSVLEQLESGVLPHRWLELIAEFQRIQTPSIVVKREVYETLGGFDSRFTSCAEDWEMWTRIAVHYPIWYEVEPLAMYRKHSSSLTSRDIKTGENIRQALKAIDIFQSYLPEEIAGRAYKNSRLSCAFFALSTAEQMLKAGEMSGAVSQIREALKSSKSLRVIPPASRIILWEGTRSLLQKLYSNGKRSKT
jgi:glycosyltransferase involved in cell wall biosynthesis